MVSPMREKRAWPPREKDADAEAVAAFEKTVAVVKETVVRSGEVLVSAKEDLNDHQRWLKVQTAQVAADRERHDRWLQRQREQQEAHERREQKRARRRRMREAVVQSVTGAIAAVVFAVRSADLVCDRQDDRRPQLYRRDGGKRLALRWREAPRSCALCSWSHLARRCPCRQDGAFARAVCLGAHDRRSRRAWRIVQGAPPPASRPKSMRSPPRSVISCR